MDNQTARQWQCHALPVQIPAPGSLQEDRPPLRYGDNKFWNHHAAEMRKARLLQAAATLLSAPEYRYTVDGAVKEAFLLEAEIDRQLGSHGT